MRRVAATLLMVVLALAGCDPVAEQPPPSPSTPTPTASAVPSEPAPTASAVPSEPAPSPSAAPTDPTGETVTGTLGGDGQLEGGCAWIETSDGRIEPLLPDGYMLSTSPVAIIGPDGTPVAEEGEQVTLVGSPAPDIMTTCQVGAVWRITAIKAGDS